jgi:hypothetical protein
MYIEKHWETIDNLRDISRVIREYYNRELADELDIFIEEQEAYIDDLKNEIVNLDNILEFEMHNKE